MRATFIRSVNSRAASRLHECNFLLHSGDRLVGNPAGDDVVEEAKVRVHIKS
jgi:hypothetical protein